MLHLQLQYLDTGDFFAKGVYHPIFSEHAYQLETILTEGLQMVHEGCRL